MPNICEIGYFNVVEPLHVHQRLANVILTNMQPRAADSFLHCVASPFHSFVTTATASRERTGTLSLFCNHVVIRYTVRALNSNSRMAMTAYVFKFSSTGSSNKSRYAVLSDVSHATMLIRMVRWTSDVLSLVAVLVVR